MKIAIVFFTYRKDADLLKFALQGVERLRRKNPADAITVYVVDDAGAALPEIPAGVEYKMTSFDRKSNLNGVECIAGMVSEYAAIAAQGYEWVIKADCDTCINDLEWLREQDAALVDYVGTRHVHDYGSGACYALSAAGVNRVAELLEDEIVRRRVDLAFCEDRAICRLANIYGRAVIHEGREVPEGGRLYHDWLPENAASMEALLTACAVDFKKCMWHSKPEDFEADRAKAVDRMAAYVDFFGN